MNRKKGKNVRALLIMLPFLLVPAGCGKSSADDQVRKVTVEKFSGEVSASRDGETWDVYEDLPLVSGDTLAVSEDGSITLLLDDDRHIYADTGARLLIDAEGEPGDGRSVITLETGCAIIGQDGKPKDKDPFILATPQTAVSAQEKGTVFSVTVTQEDGIPVTIVEAIEGEILVRTVLGGAERTQTLASGRSGTYKGTMPRLSADDSRDADESADIEDDNAASMTPKQARRANLLNVLIQIGRLVLLVAVILFLFKFFSY